MPVYPLGLILRRRCPDVWALSWSSPELSIFWLLNVPSYSYPLAIFSNQVFCDYVPSSAASLQPVPPWKTWNPKHETKKNLQGRNCPTRLRQENDEELEDEHHLTIDNHLPFEPLGRPLGSMQVGWAHKELTNPHASSSATRSSLITCLLQPPVFFLLTPSASYGQRVILSDDLSSCRRTHRADETLKTAELPCLGPPKLMLRVLQPCQYSLRAPHDSDHRPRNGCYD